MTDSIDPTTVVVPEGTPETAIIRVFDAPRELLFKAYTDPLLVGEWWGPEGVTTTVDQLDPRWGGTWRYVQRADDGEYGFRGVFHQVDAPNRLVYTFEFEGMPGHICLETVTFEELDDHRTRLVNNSVFQSLADRDGMVASGMESGARESLNRLAALVEKLG